eukprot:GEMP01007068.1.p1 GENE.GEMP01007068.1~~GEMP01007068.1.p1  ORF type:complete len:957 (+),score=166.33 GEMP01007068.1:34-2904(+)
MVDLSSRNLVTLDWSLVKIDSTADSAVASNATSVNLNENRLSQLPPNFGSVFCHAKILDLRKNQLEHFPPDFAKMVCLEELYLDFNRIAALPDEIFRLPLVTLSVTQNQLTTISPEIGKCKTLQNLFLADNVIDSLPSEIGLCEALNVFHLHNNSLLHLPTSLHKLEHIAEWSLEWLRYTTPPLPKLLKGTEWQKHIARFLSFLAERANAGLKQVSCMEFLSLFSQKQFDINGFDSKRRTRLHVTCLEGHAGVARALIQGNARLDMLDSDGYSPLLVAVREEHALIVTALVAQNVDVNKGGGLFGSPLHVCTVNFDTNLATFLINGKADVNHADNDGNTPLHVLMSVFNKGGRKSYQLGDILLDAKADCNVLNSDLWAPLHLAARRGQSSGVAFVMGHLQKHRPCPRGTCSHSQPSNDRALTCAETFDVNLRGGSHMWGPLHLAGHACHAHAVEMLIDTGCDVFLKNIDNRTARHVSRGNMALAKLIRKAEEEWLWYRVHWRDKPLDEPKLETPNRDRQQHIMEGCQSNHLSAVEIERMEAIMLKKPLGAVEFMALVSNLVSTHQNYRLTFLLSARQWAMDLVTSLDSNKMNILMYACAALNHDFIRYLFGRLSRPVMDKLLAQKDINDNNILHLICSEERTKANADRSAICEFLLLNEGVTAHLNACDIRGHTPLHRAAVLGDLQLVQVLLHFNADPNVREATAGWTPLHLATGDYPMMLALLSDNRTLPSLCDNFEWPPLLEAANKLDAKAVSLLVNAGAQKNVDILTALDSAKRDLSGKRWMLSLLGFNGFSIKDSEVTLCKEDLAVFDQEESYAPPRGAPTVFFIPEHLAPRCANCKVLFSVTVRRNWCRSCGTVYCSSCIVSVSTRLLPLDQHVRVESNTVDELQISDIRLSKAIDLSIAASTTSKKRVLSNGLCRELHVGSVAQKRPPPLAQKPQSLSFCSSCSGYFEDG